MQNKDLETLLYTAIRYKSAYYGLQTKKGWINIDDLIYKINFLECKEIFTRTTIYHMAKNNPKFTMNFLRTKIRANPINSDADLGLHKAIPPTKLFLIAEKQLKISHDKNILPWDKSEYIKLFDSIPPKTDPQKIFVVNSEQMCVAGYFFYISNTENWYVTNIPIKFISKFVRKL